MKGWLYIIKNEALAGMIRLGRSDDSPEYLVKKLDMSGSVPTPFHLQYKVYISNSYLILQNIRRLLWSQKKTAGSGWFSITEDDAISLVRREIAVFIIDRLRSEIKRGHGNTDFDTTMRTIDQTLFLCDNAFQERNSINEVKVIAQIVAGIMRNVNWLHDGLWLNRLTGGNSSYNRSNKHCWPI